MATVYLSVSSNFHPKQNIACALEVLRSSFGALELSNVYRNQPFQTVGRHYLNMALGFETGLEVEALVAELKKIENSFGRIRGLAGNTQVSIDLDLLSYETVQDELLLCADIVSRSFLLSPFSEIAGHKIDRHSGLSYAALWLKFDKSIHPLEKVKLSG